MDINPLGFSFNFVSPLEPAQVFHSHTIKGDGSLKNILYHESTLSGFRVSAIRLGFLSLDPLHKHVSLGFISYRSSFPHIRQPSFFFSLQDDATRNRYGTSTNGSDAAATATVSTSATAAAAVDDAPTTATAASYVGSTTATASTAAAAAAAVCSCS